MARTLEPVNVGTVTPVRRVRAVTIQTHWDDSEIPAQTRLAATFEYEILYTDSEGKQVMPAQGDGYITLGDAELRERADFMEAFEALSAAGDAIKEEKSAEPVTPNV